jgi:hypothetical protein
METVYALVRLVSPIVVIAAVHYIKEKRQR